MHLHRLRIIWLLVLLLAWPRTADGYSLLTHELLIDLTWQDSIVPLLLARYPNLTPAEIENARAYAYGGCVVQDIGYYPFGNIMFSNLTHYVRSGDFIVNLFRNAHNANELAFAVGALSHYIGDSIGHSEATNISVPVEFPELRERYGPVVSYAEGKHQHVQTEFAFDIDQIEHRHTAPLKFVRHVGLKVPMNQVAAAFYQTYGIADFAGYHGSEWLNVREYRWAVHSFIPHIAYAVTFLHRNHEPAEPATPDAIEIEKEVAAVSAANDWPSYRRHPGIGTYMLAGVLFILPKFGPLSLVNVKGPTPQTEADYMHSVALSTDALRRILHRFTPPRQNELPQQNARPQPAPKAPLPANQDQRQERLDPHHPLPNRDLDTGHVVQPGGYSLTDKTYAQLLHLLVSTPKQPVPPGIVRDIQTYYANPSAPITTKRDAKRWAQVQADLKVLAAMPTKPEEELYPTYDGSAASAQQK